jgi:hypothetical protein
MTWRYGDVVDISDKDGFQMWTAVRGTESWVLPSGSRITDDEVDLYNKSGQLSMVRTMPEITTPEPDAWVGECFRGPRGTVVKIAVHVDGLLTNQYMVQTFDAAARTVESWVEALEVVGEPILSLYPNWPNKAISMARDWDAYDALHEEEKNV